MMDIDIEIMTFGKSRAFKKRVNWPVLPLPGQMIEIIETDGENWIEQIPQLGIWFPATGDMTPRINIGCRIPEHLTDKLIKQGWKERKENV